MPAAGGVESRHGLSRFPPATHAPRRVLAPADARDGADHRRPDLSRLRSRAAPARRSLHAASSGLRRNCCAASRPASFASRAGAVPGDRGDANPPPPGRWDTTACASAPSSAEALPRARRVTDVALDPYPSTRMMASSRRRYVVTTRGGRAGRQRVQRAPGARRGRAPDIGWPHRRHPRGAGAAATCTHAIPRVRGQDPHFYGSNPARWFRAALGRGDSPHRGSGQREEALPRSRSISRSADIVMVARLPTRQRAPVKDPSRVHVRLPLSVEYAHAHGRGRHVWLTVGNDRARDPAVEKRAGADSVRPTSRCPSRCLRERD